MITPLYQSLGPLGYRRGGGAASVYTLASHLWKLDEVSDGSVSVQRNDSIGSAHLTDNNTVASAAKGAGAPGNMPANVANFLAASNEYLSGSTPSEYSSGAARSASFWFNLAAEGNASLFHVGTPGGVGRFLVFAGGSTPNKTLSLYAGGGFDTSAGFFALNEWHLGVYTFDGSTAHRLYVDDVLRVSRNVADSGDTTSLVFFASAAGAVNGKMSVSAHFPFVLSAEQRAALWNSGAGAILP